eukprot:9239857-Karenia_brevis.AAC.1
MLSHAHPRGFYSHDFSLQEILHWHLLDFKISPHSVLLIKQLKSLTPGRPQSKDNSRQQIGDLINRMQ